MNRFLPGRFGAALVLSLATLSSSLPHALAAQGQPQAPAAGPAAQVLRHGSRSRAGDGTLLLYDNVTGVFIVAERQNTYWIGDRFYQYEEGLWLTATLLAGPWELIAQHMVPEPARGRHAPPRDSVTAKLPSGREAVYEPRLKAFKVAGRKGVFLFDATFYRYDSGVWLASSKDDGPWTPTATRNLPGTLRKAVPLPEAGQRVKLPTGETLVFEGDTKLFAVDGKPDTVFFDGAFYERRDGKWFTSAVGASGFEEVATPRVPGPVRAKYHKARDGDAKAKGAGKGKAAGKARPAGEAGAADE